MRYKEIYDIGMKIWNTISNVSEIHNANVKKAAQDQGKKMKDRPAAKDKTEVSKPMFH